MIAVTRDDVAAAHLRVARYIRRTPLIDVDLDGVPVTLKLELLQHTGSFKPRGAFNRILTDPDARTAGVIAASGGNHGLAVAYVASVLGLTCEVFVAEVTPDVKVERIAALGASVHIGGRLYQDALEASRLRAATTGAVEIHAYDHLATVAGQGTMAKELVEQVESPASVVMAVGGGGFAAGAVAWFKDDVEVVVVEPEGSRALCEALTAGHPVDVEVAGHAADSLGARRVGEVPWSVFETYRPRSVVVSDDEIRDAQRWLWNHLRLIVEPGGATATAALLSGSWVPGGSGRTVVVVCGSNTDPRSVI